MMDITTTTLPLLQEARRHHPDGVSDITPAMAMIFELVRKDNSAQQVERFLSTYWTSVPASEIYLIDMGGIHLIGPSAASALTEGAQRFAHDIGRPLLFTAVHPEALIGLQTCSYVLRADATFCAIDLAGAPHFIGELPDRLYQTLKQLEEAITAPGGTGEGTSASDLADALEHDVSKKAVNRFSVYLQEVYSMQLVLRRKVGATEREGTERGWTYLYCPTYLVLGASLAGREKGPVQHEHP
jgi:hypothetical protein